ncbi:hypothetical protein SSP531S_48610 [Streptomyces spongiicola]|uniref:Uncharacterized protein n=1 Tax=Streptomyces spongiicola TaxID=1690221 RepID=A0A388T380_9ACTN|nr:hypothetical protein SSP531S_48610 [Streptomyces spongiicola]
MTFGFDPVLPTGLSGAVRAPCGARAGEGDCAPPVMSVAQAGAAVGEQESGGVGQGNIPRLTALSVQVLITRSYGDGALRGQGGVLRLSFCSHERDGREGRRPGGRGVPRSCLTSTQSSPKFLLWLG